jgi:flagellar biosynthesis/type III secretory pathway protein FliH
MKLSFGKVRPADPASADERTTHVRRPRADLRGYGRVAPRELVDASAEARRVLEAAERDAKTLLERARAECAEVRLRAEMEGRAAAVADFATRALLLAAREAEVDGRSLDRVVELARVLAERLLGEALRLEPARVVELARQALNEARGARRIELAAHPEDVPLLEAALTDARISGVTRIVSDGSRGRGSVRLDTDVGTLDAELAPQLDRLTARLRETLRNG